MSRSTAAQDIGQTAARATSPGTGPGLGRVIVPRVASIAAAWGTQRLLASAFRRRAGHEPPDAADTRVPVLEVIAWAVVSAGALATVQVLVDRWAARRALPPSVD